jgi:DNA uptake protein ComE-like DNA-binding protein
MTMLVIEITGVGPAKAEACIGKRLSTLGREHNNKFLSSLDF